jgi:hypothetical protein
MPQDDKIENKILDWLSKEGYPLEYEAANIFKKKKFHTFQGRYVNDYKTDNPREIDVVAQRTIDINGSFLRIIYLTECKWTGNKPWIIFTDKDSHISPSACIAQTISSNIADSILWLLAGDVEIQQLSIFKTPNRPGFNGRQAFSSQNDLVYSTLQSVISACYSEKKYSENYIKKSQDIFSHGTLIIPIVVINGKLFETYYNDDNEEMVVEEKKQIRLHWKGSEAWKFHSTIDIVTIGELNDYVRLLDKETDILMDKMVLTYNLIKQCLNENSVEPLKHLLGFPRGVISLPPILDKLSKKY